MTVIADIEADGLLPTRIWCIVTKEPKGEHKVWLDPFDEFIEYAKTVDQWVFHNGLNYDVPHINRLLGQCIDPDSVIDTLVVSRTLNYSGRKSHSLDEIGAPLGS